MKYLMIAFAVAAALVACSPKTTEIIEVETTTTTTTTTSNDGGMPKADIGEGKVVFLKNCIDCHYGRSADRVPELIDSYTEEQWADILPKMIENAKLNEEKSRQVAAYITWELKN